jgi:uncharacterized membrane protein YtjA (UPF0391 family)
MTYWISICFFVSLIAAYLGFILLSGPQATIARILFVGFMVATLLGIAFHKRVPA